MIPDQTKISVVQCTHHVSKNTQVVLSAVLGSCVAVCAFDPVTGVGGMNHILLPGGAAREDANPRNELYGTNLMELLLNELYINGANRGQLQFKFFGGGKLSNNGFDAGERNIGFIQDFARNENLNVVSSSLGGNAARRIEFHPTTGRTRQKLLVDKPIEIAVPKPVENTPQSGTIELF